MHRLLWCIGCIIGTGGGFDRVSHRACASPTVVKKRRSERVCGVAVNANERENWVKQRLIAAGLMRCTPLLLLLLFFATRPIVLEPRRRASRHNSFSILMSMSWKRAARIALDKLIISQRCKSLIKRSPCGVPQNGTNWCWCVCVFPAGAREEARGSEIKRFVCEAVLFYRCVCINEAKRCRWLWCCYLWYLLVLPLAASGLKVRRWLYF